MSQGDKSAYYRALKSAGVEFDKHYRDYTTSELQAAFDQLKDGGMDIELQAPQEPAPVAVQPTPNIPVTARAADVLPGERALRDREPIRQDEQGLIWYQEEVRKPAYPKPRGRRVLRYLETGVKTQTVQTGEYTETFEISGDLRTREAEVKITLPSYQVGIYKDPRFDFLIHVYNEARGFDYFDINRYYGGAELVPDDIKKVYIQNVLCYDIRTVIRSITTEARRLQLTGKI